MVKKLDDRSAAPRPTSNQQVTRAPAQEAKAKPAASARAKFVRDELSTGRSSAMRQRALGLTGANLAATGAPSVRTSAPAATAGLAADKASQVEASAEAVRQAGANAPAGQRERAMAEELARQSAQYRNDPVAGAALTKALAPELDAIAADLSRRVTANDDSQTHETVRALAQATENLGANAALDIAHAIARAAPDVGDLNQLDDALEGAAFDGAPRLYLAVTQAFNDAGKTRAAAEMEGGLQGVASTFIPGCLAPVDASRPDAAAEAQLRVLAASRAGNAPTVQEAYASALQVQYEALKSNPAALQAFASAQGSKLADLARTAGYSNGRLADIALKVAEASGPATLQAVADAYVSGVSVAAPELNTVAAAVSPAGAKALAFAFARAGKAELAAPFAARAAQALDSVAATAKAANDRVAELQARLNDELAQVGPALTPEQRTAYQAEFWTRHKTELDAARTANRELQQALTTELPALKALAGQSPEVANAVADTLKELARDPSQHDFVVSTIEGLKTSGAFPASFAGAERTIVEAYTVAQQARAGELLTQGDAAGAARVLDELCGFLRTTQFQSADMKEFVAQGLPTITEFAAAVGTAARTGNLDAVRAWLEDPKKAQQLDALSGKGGDIGKALAEAVTGVGVAVYLSKAAGSPSEVQRIVSVVRAGNYGAKALAFGFNALAKSTNDAVSAALKSGAKSLGGLLGKVTPIVSLGLSVYDAVGGIDAALKNPNIATLGKALGNTVSAIGGAIALFPGGQGVGLALGVIGAAIGILGGIIQGARDEGERRDEIRQVLEKIFAQPGGPLAGLSEDERRVIASRLANTHANLGELQSKGGLSAADLIALAREFPEIEDRNFSRLAAIAEATGTSGAAFVAQLRAAKAKYGEGFAQALEQWFGDEAQYARTARAEADAQGAATRICNQTGEEFSVVFHREYERLKAEYARENAERFLRG